MRAELGAALRDARARRSLAVALESPLVLQPRQRRRRPWLLAATVAVAAALLAAIALLPPGEGGAPADDGSAATEPAAGEQPPLLSRGRSKDAVSLVVERPEKSPEPRATATPGPTRRPGSGGAGSGSGTSPGPTRTPSFVTETRFYGRVVDESTRRGLAGVCIVVGNRTCEETPVRTDREGNFSILLPAPGIWDLNFALPGYVTAYRRVASDNTQPTVNVGVIGLPPR